MNRWPRILAAVGVMVLTACNPSDGTEDTDVAVVPDASYDAGPADASDDVTRDTTDITEDTVSAAPIAFSTPRDSDVVLGQVAIGVVLSPPTATVTFLVDGEPIGHDDRAPYAISWSADLAATGQHNLSALAEWPDGSTDDATIQVFVDRTLPEVAFIEPGRYHTGLRADGTLEVALAVSDDHGIRTAMVSINDGQRSWPVLGPDFTAELDLSILPPGSYPMTATVTDLGQNTATASTVFQVCEDDRFACGGNCLSAAEFQERTDHCGGCNLACDPVGERCVEGACVCAPGTTECAGGCVDLLRATSDCGACGSACESGESCLRGACVEPPAGFVPVTAGTFEMGIDSVIPDDASPAHEVTITRDFYLGETEVTQGQWSDVIGFVAAADWACGENCPIESITWWEALHYCNALSEREGLSPCYLLNGCTDKPVGAGRSCENVYVNAPRQNPAACEGYRLPTEAEWEFAYRGGTDTEFYNGSLLSLFCEISQPVDIIAWYSCNTRGIQPVAGLLPNSFGLYDMAGNVFEWVWDGFAPYPDAPRVDPVGEATLTTTRTIRGGSWNELADRLTATSRLSHAPSSKLSIAGFRVARTVSP